MKLQVVATNPRARGTQARRAFTLIELFAVLVIVLLLLATFVPYAMAIRESANRTRCVANLGNIGRALGDYQLVNGHSYPRVRFSAVAGNRWTAFTGADDLDPFASTSAVEPNDVTASLWLLVREGLAKPEWFICPSGGGQPDEIVDAAGAQTVVKKRGNFRSQNNLSYGYATPFSSIGDYRLVDTLPSRFALLADRAPSAGTLYDAAAAGLRYDASPKSFRRINSTNHRGAGQNVLYADTTVRFEWSPYCGVGTTEDKNNGDNIFSALAAVPLVSVEPPANNPGVAGVGIGPAYRYDTVLVPFSEYAAAARAEAASPPKPPRATSSPASAPTSSTAPATAPTTQP